MPAASTAGASRRPVSAVEGYAQAIVAVADAEGVLERVENELYEFARAVESNPELSQRLTDPAAEVSTKLGIVSDLLKRAHPQTIAAVGYIIQAGRGRQLRDIAGAVVQAAAHRNERALAEVRSAVPLAEDQRRRLTEALTQQAGRAVELKVVVDPELVGGVVVTMGDIVIDGSVARRLSDVRARLVGA